MDSPEAIFLRGLRMMLVVVLLIMLVETMAILAAKYAIWLWRVTQ